MQVLVRRTSAYHARPARICVSTPILDGEDLISVKDMYRARFGVAVLLIGALAAGFTFFRKESIADSHRRTRQIILHYTVSRVDDPIILLGDSITEASTLPREFCGHRIVNAGLDGASTASELGPWLIDVLDGRRAAAIVVSLGTNDALQARSMQDFEASYAELLAQLVKATDHLAILAIPGIDVLGRMTVEKQAVANRRINGFNAALPALAAKAGARFIALPDMQAPHTIDGVHLNSAGYLLWEEAILQGVSTTCGPR